ncbi:hypothetical protein H0H92_015445 [Tricholoma furcatifolium]|nr:hypothetical protein H0H92_015445 [Tricholoma furcatifolium]
MSKYICNCTRFCHGEGRQVSRTTWYQHREFRHTLGAPTGRIPPNATTPAAMDLDHLSIHPPFTNDTNELDMDMEPPRPSPSMPQTLHIDIEGTGQIGGDQDDEQPEEQEYAPQQQSASNSFC